MPQGEMAFVLPEGGQEVVLNYTHERTKGANVKDLTGKALGKLMSVKNNGGDKTACEIMRRDTMSKLLIDLDDRLPTLAEAEAKTAEFVRWAQEDLPPMLGIDPEEARDHIVIATMPGQEWKMT